MKATIVLAFLLTQGVAHAVDNLDVPKPIGLELDSRLREVPITIPEQLDFDKEFYTRTRDRMEYRFYDKLNPVRVQLNNLNDPERNLISQSQVLTAMNHSFRQMAAEMVLETPYVQKQLEWMEYKLDKAGKIVRRLLVSLISYSPEQDVDIMHDPAFQYSEHELRGQTGKLSPYGFGARWPDPYVYLGTRIGHYDGQDLFFAYLRFHSVKMESYRVEALITKPLPMKFDLSAGIEYSPHENYRRLGRVTLGKLKLEKLLGDDPSMGVFVASVAFANKTSFLVSYQKPF
jgi:hypothetical protein